MSDVLSNYSIINNLTRIINDIMACLSPKNKVMILTLIFLFVSVSSIAIIVLTPRLISYPYVKNTVCLPAASCVYGNVQSCGEKLSSPFP